MSHAQLETEHKFWMIPEMIAKLLPFLDLKSTLCLAHAHEKTHNVLKGAMVFNKLLKRNSPLTKLDNVKDLATILKLMKDPKANLSKVLDVICETNPQISNPNTPDLWPGPGVRMGCPCHLNYHSISSKGFELLEEVEGALGTTEQTVESVIWGNWILPNNFMAALASRLTRQQEKVTSINIGQIDMSTKKQAEHFKTLMQALPSNGPSSRTVKFGRLKVLEPIGAEGWEFVAQAVKTHPGLLSDVVASQDAFNGVKVEDMRVIWEALKRRGSLIVAENYRGSCAGKTLLKQDGEAAWTKLWQILDLSTEEWAGLGWRAMEDF